MLAEKSYRRENAVNYAKKFAFAQNPLFGDFKDFGGNCTNFASQCVYAGCCEMNFTPTFGWYYISLNERSPSWTGVEYFYNFITENEGVGPYGREVGPDDIEIGDIIQLANNRDGFYHTLVVVGFNEEVPLVAAQTIDAYARPLNTYNYDYNRYIKILGARFETAENYSCYERLMSQPAVPRPGESGEAEGQTPEPIITPEEVESDNNEQIAE